MRRYGLYDTTRGLTTLAAIGGAGVLLWAATLVGQRTDGRFWAEMAIVAGAGLVIALSQVIGGWTKGLHLRVSPATFVLAFIPTLVVVGWILVASQPGHGWHEGTLISWSRHASLVGLIHDLALWHGVLAFGFGLVLGISFDTVPALEPAVVAPAAATAARPVPSRTAADEPATAERQEVGTTTPGQPREVTVGPRSGRFRRRTPTTMD
ncbi:MAG: hypothetical protein JOY72_10255 [Actinobacteria bacterium]|nr:hypothetical protein [Actinomycetota bacterium]